MSQPEITAYLKTTCGWSNGVRAVLAKYSLPYTEKDIIRNPAFRFEMEQKSGQPLSPAWRSTGSCSPTSAAREVEAYMLEKGIVTANDVKTDVPLNAPCTDAQHEAMAREAAQNIKVNF